jgi:Kdo2-lipid IVA lauroyltransferase/acyltransferase
MLVRLAAGVLWLLHLLPMGWLAAVGNALGWVAHAVATDRRRVADINLRLCFPQLSEQERARVIRRHFQSFARAMLEQGLLWWSSADRLRRLVQLEGVEHWLAARDRPVILLAPHFVGLDMGGFRFNVDYALVSIYSQQKNRAANRVMLRYRNRFGTAVLFSRQDGVKPVLRALRQGLPFYYLPDQDFGPKDAVFAPFFGVPAATITGLSRIARITGARVVPCVTRQRSGSLGYTTTLYPAWTDYPSADVAADTRRMNAFIEQRVLEMPEQYFWTHKRFKTAPLESMPRSKGAALQQPRKTGSMQYLRIGPRFHAVEVHQNAGYRQRFCGL